MAKSKVAPDAPAPQPASRSDAPHTIPLEAVRIQWTRARHFWGESDDVPLEISGAQLGQILAWLSITRPGYLGKIDDTTGAAHELWPRGEVAAELEGLSGFVDALTTTEKDTAEIGPALSKLRGQLADLAGRLWALEEAPDHLKRATVTIGAPTTEAK